MSTTTVRLDTSEEQTLDELAQLYGGRSNALRAGLRLLAEEARRQKALGDFVDDWERESGPVSEADIEATAKRYGL